MRIETSRVTGVGVNQGLELISAKRGFAGPTFTMTNRARRGLWSIAWFILARWTPPPFHRWRVLILRAFGGQVSWRAYVYPDVRIWAPWNLRIAEFGTLARQVVCYNIATVSIESKAVVSQGAHLCTGTHDYRDSSFPLQALPIVIGRRAWICANAIVGPGVAIGDGAVLGIGSVATRDLEPWSIHAGNPAVYVKARPVLDD